jgi:rRNA maturation endonuclease Nob1
MNEYCEWTEHLSAISYHHWETECGHISIASRADGICPYCGKKIKIIYTKNKENKNV